LPYREIDQSGFLLSILNENAPYCCTNVGELIAPLKIADIGWNLGKPEEKTIGKNLELIVSNPAEIYSKKKNLEGWKKIHSLFGWDTSALVLKSLYQKIVSQ
ncbi:MAG: hypothetical protein K2F72_04490, partial [Muribaculaceae bacterium]|nr:hypothetical protein [Muribaculaceae bacterium]